MVPRQPSESGDEIRTITRLQLVNIVAGAAIERITSWSTIERIGPVAAIQRVRTRLAS